ncbi:MAG: putative glycosyl transferase [Frankiales bacterium]|nr:putative glycosyl transferase [Frankiales bacterium]
MRVALVCGRDEPRRDGVADYVHRLAAALPAYGVQAEVVEAGGRVLAAARDLRRLDPDVVHVQFAPSAYGYGPAVGLLPALVRAPVVTTLHEYGWWSWPARVPSAAWSVLERGGRWDRETLRLVPASGAVVVTNPAHERAVRERLGVVPRLVPIGPNVDRVPADRAEVRRRHGLPQDAPVAVFFGFVHPVKGVRWLLGAVAALRATIHPDLHLVVAGGFDSLALPGQEARDFEAEVRAGVAALGLDDVVRITGWVAATEVSALLQAADVAALPFTHGLTTKSGSLLAVLDHDLPLVGTRGKGTTPELEAAAWLGPVRESEVLAQNLRSALEQGPRPAARVLADAHAWDAAAKAHAEVYEGVLRRG